VRTKILLAVALAVRAPAAFGAAVPAPPAPEGAFAVRMVKLAGRPGVPATEAHLRYCRALGFNALWVYSGEAGRWWNDRATKTPVLDPAFVRLTRWCRKQRMDVTVSINPVADSRHRFVFTDPEHERRLMAFIALLREKAGVTRIVLSFDDQPTQLRALADVFRYGTSSAPAHLDLARRVAAQLSPGITLWLCAAAYCDAHLGDGTRPYSKAFLEGLPALPPRIGIVWTGPSVVSRSITRADIVATRARLGGRAILLYDNFPENENESDDAIALILGALRSRDPELAGVVAGYLACPALPLAGSRLTLSTSAEFLLDPRHYDPETAVKHALARIAGDDRGAYTALETQQLEWGGFVDGRNYWPAPELNPEIAGGRLHDPAFVESFTWTADRYPGRMTAMSGLADTAFRDDVLRLMRRRLAIAQAMPLTVEYLARSRAGRADSGETLAQIDALRRSWDPDCDARRTLERFLAAASVPPPDTLR